MEISNHCRRKCAYCGLRAPNTKLRRYRMSIAEILDSTRLAARLGYGTVVLQAGEDEALTSSTVAEIIKSIRADDDAGGLAITLSLGERSEEELAIWKQAGADRYLLRFETSNRTLFRRIHPPVPGHKCDRMAILATLRKLGYEVGSGIMVGLPGQTHEDLARDIEAFIELDLDMIGIGPYVPHVQTPLATAATAKRDQSPPTATMAHKVIALTRLAIPDINMPATTALNAIDGLTGYEVALSRGANVVMPDLTPPQYRCLYDIYPMNRSVDSDPVLFDRRIRLRIQTIGRDIATGRGDSYHYIRRAGTRHGPTLVPEGVSK